jgi:DNA recombination protein RmuC
MSSLFLLLAALLGGLLLGALAMWLAHRPSAAASARERERSAGELEAARREAAELRAASERIRAEHARVEGELSHLRAAQAAMQAERRSDAELHRELHRDFVTAKEQLAASLAELKRERESGEEKLALLSGARTELAHHFQALANEILEEKTRRFTDHNKTNLEGLLGPMREKMGEFQTKVESLHLEGVKGQAELRAHILDLRAMNDRLSADANNLVKALKGSSKTQGDWGEVVLATLLEGAGMQQGREYRLQETLTNEDGRRVRPDVILDLPRDKHLVIDSKVSLTSYAEYCACEDEEARKLLLERHGRSMRDHVDGLSLKAYQTLYGLSSLDFVIMFVPIEPAYLLALAHDGGLWQRAWNRNVLLLSPSTLYPVLRTIQYAWQNERQSRNIEEIVQRGGALYDKFVVFAKTFEEVGQKLKGAQDCFDKAHGQFVAGKGNLVSRVEILRQKGVRTTKTMPEELLREALAPGLTEELFPEEVGPEQEG